jgi:amino acid transporter
MAVTEVSPSVGDKGLKKDALGFVSSVVIGVASTAPGYSLAASLGFVVAIAGVGLQAPAVLLVAFIPMLLIASAYYYMNRADPDCGTTFAWVTKAMGPSLGWMGGWAIVVADVIVPTWRRSRGCTRSCSSAGRAPRRPRSRSRRSASCGSWS